MNEDVAAKLRQAAATLAERHVDDVRISKAMHLIERAAMLAETEQTAEDRPTMGGFIGKLMRDAAEKKAEHAR